MKNVFYIHKYLYFNIRGSLNKFTDFFRMGTFIDSTHNETLVPLQSNFLQLQSTYIVPTTSGRPHGSPRVSVSMTFITASFISSIVS